MSFRHYCLRQNVCEQLVCTDQSSFHIEFDRLLCFFFWYTVAPISATVKLRVHQITEVDVPARVVAWRALCDQLVPTFQIPAYTEFSRRVVLVLRLCTVTSISSTLTSYRQHVAKVGVPARIIASYVVRGTRRHK